MQTTKATTEALYRKLVREEKDVRELRDMVDMLQEAFSSDPDVQQNARELLSDPTRSEQCPTDRALRQLLAFAEARLAQLEGVSQPIRAENDEAALRELLRETGCRLPEAGS